MPRKTPSIPSRRRAASPPEPSRTRPRSPSRLWRISMSGLPSAATQVLLILNSGERIRAVIPTAKLVSPRGSRTLSSMATTSQPHAGSCARASARQRPSASATASAASGAPGAERPTTGQEAAGAPRVSARGRSRERKVSPSRLRAKYGISAGAVSTVLPAASSVPALTDAARCDAAVISRSSLATILAPDELSRNDGVALAGARALWRSTAQPADAIAAVSITRPAGRSPRRGVLALRTER